METAQKTDRLTAMFTEMETIVNDLTNDKSDPESINQKIGVLYSKLNELEGLEMRYGANDPLISKAKTLVNKAIDSLKQHSAFDFI